MIEQFSSVPLVLKIVQILLKEYQVIEEAKDLAKPPGEDSSGEEGENEEDLDQTESPFVDADFLDFVEDDEEELEDPDVQSDPIFSLDLKVFFFSSSKSSWFVIRFPRSTFVSSFVPLLKATLFCWINSENKSISSISNVSFLLSQIKDENTLFISIIWGEDTLNNERIKKLTL